MKRLHSQGLELGVKVPLNTRGYTTWISKNGVALDHLCKHNQCSVFQPAVYCGEKELLPTVFQLHKQKQDVFQNFFF